MNLITLRRREGVNDLESIQNEVNRLFNTSMSRWLTGDGVTESAWLPAIDVRETKDEVLVLAEVPGVSKDDIQITVHEGILTIKGEKKQVESRSEEWYVRNERRYGSFSKSITLPAEVDVNKADAQYQDGVLRLQLPKLEEAKPKEIQIKVK